MRPEAVVLMVFCHRFFDDSRGRFLARHLPSLLQRDFLMQADETIHLGMFATDSLTFVLMHELGRCESWIRSGYAFRMSFYPLYYHFYAKTTIDYFRENDDDSDPDISDPGPPYTGFTGAMNLLRDRGPGASRRSAGE
jgi:hypothetical protein